jgi:hypothetical protein
MDLIKNQLLTDRFQSVCQSLHQEFPLHSEYINLQKTWNVPALTYIARWLPSNARVLSIGSFLGAMEITLSGHVKEIVCCDLEDFLPKSRPANMVFRKINLDSADLNLPEEHFDVCICIEVLEHLRWSPLPMLQWMREHCNLLVISTPDDKEWPPVEQAPWTTTRHFSNIPFPRPSSEGNPKPMSHSKQYGQGEFVELIEQNCFRLLELQRVGEGGHQMLAIAAAREIESVQLPLVNRFWKYYRHHGVVALMRRMMVGCAQWLRRVLSK